jgi:hypothetical protein
MRTVRTVVSPLFLKCVPGPPIDARLMLRRGTTSICFRRAMMRTLRALVRTLADAAMKPVIETQGLWFQWVATLADAADAVFPNFMGGGRGQNGVGRKADAPTPARARARRMCSRPTASLNDFA